MKKYLLLLLTLIFSIFIVDAKQASCSDNDGVSYVTVSVEFASGGSNVYVKGYGKYKDATAFITYKRDGILDKDKVFEITVDIKDGEGYSYLNSVPESEIRDLKVTVASFCK